MGEYEPKIEVQFPDTLRVSKGSSVKLECFALGKYVSGLQMRSSLAAHSSCSDLLPDTHVHFQLTGSRDILCVTFAALCLPFHGEEVMEVRFLAR